MHILKCHASKFSKTASRYIGALAAEEGMLLFPLTLSHGAKTGPRTLIDIMSYEPDSLTLLEQHVKAAN